MSMGKFRPGDQYGSSPRAWGTSSHHLNGSALGDGMDWMIRKGPSVLAQSVFRIFPSGAGTFNP